MGLVVTTPTSGRPRSENVFDPLDAAEEILYVSPSDELSSGRTDGLILVVTLNEKTGMYTVWTARYRDKSFVHPQSTRRKSSSAMFSKRRSSHFDLPTGASTPVARGPSGVRESFGGVQQSWNASTMTHPLHGAETGGDKSDDLAAQLGHEFGDTWKTSRRVSSLLARSELVGNYDRSTFTDLAAGNQAASSMARRGDSIGGYSNRPSFGFSQRSSLPGGYGSTFNNSVSFLDAPVDKFLEGLSNAGDFEGFDRMGLTETVSGLPREVILTKVASQTSGFSTTLGTPAFRKGQKFEVFTLRSDVANSNDATTVSVCIVNKNSRILTILDLSAEKASGTEGNRKDKHNGSEGARYAVQPVDSRNIYNVVDSRKLVDGEYSQILLLSAPTGTDGELILQSPRGHAIRLDLPPNLAVHHPYDASLTRAPGRGHDAGLKRVISSSGLRWRLFGHSSNNGKITVIDDSSQKHRLQIQLEPRNPLVKKALATCKFVLRDSNKPGGFIHVCWCEVMKWLRMREDNQDDGAEWTALVVTLFSMAVPFTQESSQRKPVPKKRRGAFLRVSSSSSADLEDWEAMLDRDAGSSGTLPSWTTNPAWGWIPEQETHSMSEPTEGLRLKGVFTPTTQPNIRENSYILRCATLARDFLQSPPGARASGPDGCLPTATAVDNETRKTRLGLVLVGLQLLREEQKLCTPAADLPNSPAGLLAPVLAQIGRWMGWKAWTWKPDGYYGVEMASLDRWRFEDSQITQLNVPAEPFPPPSIFAYVESSLQRKETSFLSILEVVSSSGKSSKGRLWEQALALTPRTLALVGFMSELNQQQRTGDSPTLLLAGWHWRLPS
jgi:anaphase-promoting complex subunit 1